MKKEFFQRKWIKNATYEELLRKHRFAPLNDELFIGNLGKYFGEIMCKKKQKLTPGEQVQASKNIGWK